MTYERIQAWHLEAWGLDAGGIDTFAGLARVEGGVVTAIGGVWELEGRWIALFEERSPRRHSRIHRLALKTFHALERCGVSEVWAQCDESVPRARAWMLRLGFQHVTGDWWRRDSANAETGGDGGEGGESREDRADRDEGGASGLHCAGGGGRAQERV